MTVTTPFTGPRDEYRDDSAEGPAPDADTPAGPGAGSTDRSQGRPAATGLKLLPPRHVHAAEPLLSADQQAAVDVPQGAGPVLMPGAPGTGKTTTLVEAAVRRVFRD